MSSQPVARRLVLGDFLGDALVAQVLLVLGYAALIGLTAQIVIILPFTPVPITGQTFGVLVGAMVLGTRRATIGSLIYLFLGLVGIPWFAGASGGFEIVSTPSFGYLLGFVLASYIVGTLAEKGFDRKFLGTLGVMVVGNLVIYLLGAGWLAFVSGLGLNQAILLGVVPFLIGDGIKALLADVLLPTAWRVADRFESR